MTAELEQVRRLAQEHGNHLAFVINQSGGKDSTRMMGLVRQTFPDMPTYAVMADTGFEHKAPVLPQTGHGHGVLSLASISP